MNSKYADFLTFDGNIFRWSGNYTDLKNYIDEELKLTGKWSSPGGEVKLFTSDEDLILKFQKSKRLVIVNDDENQYLFKSMEALANDVISGTSMNNCESVNDVENVQSVSVGSYFEALNLESKLMSSEHDLEGDGAKFSQEDLSKDPVNVESTKYKNLHQDFKTTSNNLHTCSQNCCLNMNSKLESYTQIVTTRLDALTDEISSIRENKDKEAYAVLVLEKAVEDLKKEKLEIEIENHELKEKNKNLYTSLTEARAKVIDLQDEKSSLITAMKLIQREQMLSTKGKSIEELIIENNSLKEAARALQEDLENNRNYTREFTKEKQRHRVLPPVRTTPDTTNTFETRNQFEVLEIRDESEVAISATKEIMTESQETGQQENKAKSANKNINEQETSQQENNTTRADKNTNDRKSKRNILLIGDSIIKNINPHKLSKYSVRKLTYPGKRAEDIAEELETAHMPSRPTEVIIHAGTNNLLTDSSKECCDNLKRLTSVVKTRFKEAKIAISSILLRQDVDVALKSQETNELLRALCDEQGYSFIDNETIDTTCLNGSNLHLNAKGSALLASHFIKFLRKGQYRPTSYEDFPKEFQQLEELLRMFRSQKLKKRRHR